MVVKAIAQLICGNTCGLAFGPVQATNTATTGLHRYDFQPLFPSSTDFDAR